jgi:2-C-methyl-D-erythritol 4-phosphate cytidylyltransferase
VVYGVVVAGGQGVRLGEKKQYRSLAGKPMWERSARALLEGGFSKVWLVVPEPDVAEIRTAVCVAGLQESMGVTAGGATRFDSVRAGLMAVFAEENSAERMDEALDLWIGVHDAARPFVTQVDVQAVVEAAKIHGGAILAQPCPDTVKRVGAGLVQETVSRVELWLAQTPQVFRAQWMQAAYWADVDCAEVTDDASVIERAGHFVAVVAATGENRKVTTKADLEYAECLAQMRWGGEQS